MRMNTINVPNINTSQDYSMSSQTQKKLKFPTLSPIEKSLKPFKLRKINSISKRRVNTESKTNDNLVNRIKINPNIKMVNHLNFEENVDNILNTDLNLIKQKEKIDKNKTIKLIRLGLYKKKEKEKDNIIEKNDIGTIAEKEKENEEDLEKIDIENREKEKKLEKKFKESLINIEQLKNECENLNSQINNNNKIIEDYQIELNVLDNYAEEYDNKMKAKIEENKDNENSNNNSDLLESSKKKRLAQQQLFEHMNKMIILKQQRDDKKKIIQENILIKESIKKKLENDLIKKRIICNQEKKNLYIIRKNLINSYHLKLYEGLDFHGEGLPSIIKDIWNLGVNVNVSFMPSYLGTTAPESR